MAFPEEHLWNFVDVGDERYFVSTADTPDKGLETMVFPASKDAKIVESIFRTYVEGVDFGNPLEEYTSHYSAVKDAMNGHRRTRRKLKTLIRE